MPTNEERKAVAARLRDFESLRPVFKDSNICGFLEALGVDYMDWKGICDRLADFIEPEPVCVANIAFTAEQQEELFQRVMGSFV